MIATTHDLKAGVVYQVYGKSRDLGYGSEDITGPYVWTGEIDMWGKFTMLPAFSDEPAVYLFADEIEEFAPLYGNERQ